VRDVQEGWSLRIGIPMVFGSKKTAERISENHRPSRFAAR
jgi:hypothetical protein